MHEPLVTLNELIPDDMFVGTSLILHKDGRFLYGIRPVKNRAGTPYLELTGIGGGLEEEDHTYSDGARREAREEIGCEVDLCQSERTLIVRDRETVQWLRMDGNERPAAIVFRNHRTPAHQPWHPINQGQACLIVFQGKIEGQPRPTMELPWLIWLSPEQILETAHRDVPLSQLIADGATLINREGGPPVEVASRMTDSQEALALALGDKTISVYRSFVQ